MNTLKNTLFYSFCSILLLLLFHFESLEIGPVKISHLWKGVLLAYLTVTLLFVRKIKTYIYSPLLLLSVLQIFNFEIVNNPFNAILLFGTTLIIPLIGMYAFRFSSLQLKSGLMFFSSFFILCFVPYKLGIISSFNEGYRLTSYGVEDVGGLIGPFQTVHSASTALAGALLVVVYFWFVSAYNKLYLLVLFVLGFYFLFATYVRTGLLMFVVGLLPIIFHFGRKSVKSFIRLIVIGMMTAVLVGVWVLSNETLMDRITGQRTSQSEFSSIEKLGSGRGGIYLANLKIYAEANFFEKILGVGQTQQLERMSIHYHKELIPHNGFLFILLNNGVLGLMVFLYFLEKIARNLKNKHNDKAILVKSLFLAYLVMTFFQNYNILYTTFLMFLSIALFFKPNSVESDGKP